MAVNTYTVNLDGNMASGARAASAGVRDLVRAMTSLEAATLGLVAVTAGLGAALVGMTFYAIEASEQVNRLSSSFGALSGQGPEAGRKTLDAVRAIAAELPQSEKIVSSWAQQLMAAGVTDMSQIKAQLYAISGAEALVEGGGERLRSVLGRLNEASERGTKVRFNVAQLQGTGVTETELLKQLGMSPQQLELAKKRATITGGELAAAITNAVNAKASGPLSRMMGDISTRLAKGKDVLSHLFEGISFDKVGEELTTFFSIFDQATPSGSMIKDAIGGALTWVGDKLAWALHQATLFFLDTIILTLRARIAWRDFQDGVQAFADKTMATIRAWAPAVEAILGGVSAAYLTTLAPAIWAATTAFVAQLPWIALSAVQLVALGAEAAIAFIAALPSLVAYTVMMGALALETLLAASPFILLAIGIGLVVAALIYFWPQIKKAIAIVAEWAKAGWDAAVNFVAGMVGGIVNGVSRVVDAVKNLGKSAWEALTSFWKVHSPSQLAFGLGANIAEGQAQGIESKDARVQTASTDTLASPMSSGGGGRGGSSGMTQNNEFHIQVIAHDGQQAREVVDEFEERLPSLLERWALSQGVAPA